MLSVACSYGYARFGYSDSNHVNVHAQGFGHETRRNLIDATLKIRFTYGDSRSQCTAVLINRDVSDEALGYFILTARHCFFTNDGRGDKQFDPNAYHYLIFNYQSPDCENDSTPESNRGAIDWRNNPIQSTSPARRGFQYVHRTKLRLIAYYFWGDFALLEILTPVPPHFNVAFAGWNPSSFNSGTSIHIIPSPFVGIHHPRGDIKKAFGASNVVWGLPVETVCHTVTAVIDFLFGWIWGRRVSTRVICKYVDIPWILVPNTTYGVMREGGASGSGLFNSSNQLVGVLAGALNSYGRFRANYFNSAVRNVLNPSGSYALDVVGMRDRRVTRRNNLVLPGGNLDEGFFFPAKHHQPENEIILRANHNISTNRPITIFDGAHYEFVAGDRITLGNGFRVEEGARFSARNERVNNPRQEELSAEQQIINRLRDIDLPNQLDFYIP